jgi:hypothetical protein
MLPQSVSIGALCRASRAGSDSDQALLQAALWDVLDQIWAARLEKTQGGSGSATQLKSMPTDAKAARIKSREPSLAHALDRYELLARRGRHGLLERANVREFVELSEELAGASVEESFRTRVPLLRSREAGREHNRASVETTHGFRSITLRHAMVTEQDAELVVLTGLAGARPGGFIVDHLADCHGFVCDGSAPFLRFADSRWTSLQSGNYPVTAFRHVLTVMLPDIVQDRDRLGRIRTMCGGIRASLAALEALGVRLDRVALPVLQAHLLSPGEEYRCLVTELLAMAATWLKQSAHTTEVMFCVYFGDELETWSGEFDRALGRALLQPDEDFVIRALRDEIVRLTGAIRRPALRPEVDDMVAALRGASLRVGPLMTTGRTLVERFCAIHYSERAETRPFELWKAIDGLGAFGVSPWLRSYLHTLRVLGNEGVHVRSDAHTWSPAQLSRDDMVTGLSALRALLGFCASRDDEARLGTRA